MYKKIFIIIVGLVLFFPGKLKSQSCLASAGSDTSVCTGDGSQYRVYLDGSQSYVENGSVNYEWTVLDDGISISSSQSDEVDPYFKYLYIKTVPIWLTENNNNGLLGAAKAIVNPHYMSKILSN